MDGPPRDALPNPSLKPQYPPLVSIATNNPGAALGDVIQNNISYSNAAWVLLSDGAETNLTVLGNFTSGDPQFVNCAQRDFTLSSNSPALSLGFQPIPMNRFGPVPLPPSGVIMRGP